MTLARRCALVLVLAAGCADSIRPDHSNDDAALPTADGPLIDALLPTGTVTTGANADGSYTTIVDASALAAWIYVDFATRAQVTETDPWDLRFQRFHISTNGGVSGTGGVEVAALAGKAFTEVTAPPASGWIADAPDGDDGNFDPDYAFEQGDGWYDYNSETHVLTARPLVWVARTTGGAAIKLQLERYYDTAGTPGWFTFRWAAL